MTEIRVGILSKPSQTITINKPFNHIKTADIRKQIKTGHILGWCKVNK